ncbi:unnamed protein product [Nesidiocoris tenuis]|uniref:Uncharacterized protein n=1 Tax=Nesidiocoris tenuis TaxID=355587 RepID=A0A6H5GQM6_9HEMI|nr:unnamed protein product [Nesidiocoris tenuis]
MFYSTQTRYRPDETCKICFADSRPYKTAGSPASAKKWKKRKRPAGEIEKAHISAIVYTISEKGTASMSGGGKPLPSISATHGFHEQVSFRDGEHNVGNRKPSTTASSSRWGIPRRAEIRPLPPRTFGKKKIRPRK